MRRVAVLVLGMVGLAGAVAGCGGSDDASSTASTGGGASTSAAKDEVVKVGYVGTLSGPYAASEVTILNGFKAGLEYAEKQGAAEGISYEVEVRDTADPTQAAAAVRELAQDGVKAIYGPRAAFAGVQPILNQNKVIGINSNFEGMLDQVGDSKQYPWAFGTGETEADRTELQVAMATESTKSDTIAQIADATDFGKQSSEAVAAQMEDHPDLELASAEFPLTATDVSKQLSDLQKSGADTLLVWTFGDYLIKVAAGLKKIGWAPQIYTIVGAKYDTAIKAMESANPGVTKTMIGGPVPNGFVATSSDQQPTGITKDFIDVFKQYQKGSTATDGNTLVATYGFDGAMIVNAAIAGSDSTDTTKMKEALTSGEPIEGVRGTYVFGPDVRLAQDIAHQASLIQIAPPCSSGLCEGASPSD